MHRHGYKGRKLSRKRDQRSALLRNLATSLIEYRSIDTTLPKAKEVLPYVERLVSKAKVGGLHNRRQIIAALDTIYAVDELFDVIVPALKRDSGFLRIEKTDTRKGDNAQMARVSFVDDTTVKSQPKSSKATTKTPAKAKKSPKPSVKAKQEEK